MASITGKPAPSAINVVGGVDQNGDVQPFVIDGSGTMGVTITGGKTDSESTTGAAAPTTATLIGAVDPTNDLQPLKVDASGNLQVVTSGGITSASEGPTGALVPAQATYIGANDPLNNLVGLALDSNGDLRTTDKTIAVTSTTAPNYTSLVGGESTFGNIEPLQVNGGKLLTYTDVAVDSNVFGHDAGGIYRLLRTDANGELQVDVLSSALPSGAATETTLSSINGKLATLGQKAMAGSTPVVIASDQSAIPITGTITASNPSVGTLNATAPTSATLLGGEDSAGLLQELTVSTGQVVGNEKSLNVKTAPAFNWYADTSKVIAASGIDTTFWDVVYSSAGQAYSQSAGHLQMNTTGNAFLETVIRSKQSFHGNMVAKVLLQSLARYFGAGGMFELVDVIGNNLTCTVTSATSATITISSNPFTSENVGQSFYLGGYSGTGVLRPGRYAISAVAGNDVTLTISSGTAGSGTVCAWGYNYAGFLFTSSGSTSGAVRVHRNGWPSTTNQSTITTNSTNSTVELQINLEDNMVSFFEQAASDVTSIDTSNLSMKLRALNHVPDPSKEYYLQLRVHTDSTTTSTAYYFFHPNVAVYDTQPVTLFNNKPQSANSAPPTRIIGGTLSTVSTVSTVNTVTTVNTVSAVTSVAQSRPSTPAITSDNVGTITSTTTSSTYSPTWGSNYVFTVAVTAASGTNPTLDVAVQATDDIGTNWYTIYEFPRMTGLGRWSSPPIRNNGLDHRFVSTVGGVSPSFTRTIRRSALAVDRNTARSIIDRTIDLNTLNSTSRTMVADYTNRLNILLRCTAQTTAATITFQFSDDEVLWVNHPTTLASVNGNATLDLKDWSYRYIRAIVTAAGSGITLDKLSIKGFET